MPRSADEIDDLIDDAMDADKSASFNGRSYTNHSLPELDAVRRSRKKDAGADTAVASEYRGLIFNKISAPGAA